MPVSKTRKKKVKKSSRPTGNPAKKGEFRLTLAEMQEMMEFLEEAEQGYLEQQNQTEEN